MPTCLLIRLINTHNSKKITNFAVSFVKMSIFTI